jgi:hypothetical protein
MNRASAGASELGLVLLVVAIVALAAIAAGLGLVELLRSIAEALPGASA